MVKRRSIKVPEDIVTQIDGCIENSKGQFRSRPEVVVAALERFFAGKRRGRKRKG